MKLPQSRGDSGSIAETLKLSECDPNEKLSKQDKLENVKIEPFSEDDDKD